MLNVANNDSTAVLKARFLGAVLFAALSLGSIVNVATASPLYTLADGNSTFEINTSAQATAYEWNVDGKQHLRELSNWYRVGNTAEASVHTLNVTNETPVGANQLTVEYTDQAGRFTIEITYGVQGGAPGSGFSTMGENVRIKNTSGAALDFRFFEYVDLNLDETPNDDLVWMSTQSSLEQSDPVTHFTTLALADRYELDFQGATLAKLTDNAASNLSGVWPLGAGPVGIGDVTWALQWNFVGPLAIAPGATAVLSKECRLQMLPVPEPATWALAAIGGCVLLRIRVRRSLSKPSPRA